MTQYLEPTMTLETFHQIVKNGNIQFACSAGHCWLNVPGLPQGYRCEHQNSCLVRNPEAFILLGFRDWSDLTAAAYAQVEKNKDE